MFAAGAKYLAWPGSRRFAAPGRLPAGKRQFAGIWPNVSAGEAEETSFLKKKGCLLVKVLVPPARSATATAKVFWFFFSKKNTYLFYLNHPQRTRNKPGRGASCSTMR
jgi:hypothetical protein